MNRRESAAAALQRRWPKTATERFLSYAEPEPNSGCWLWMAARGGFGLRHGKFFFHGREIGAHRAAWLLFKGEIPHGMCVLHKCDMEWCVNPAHLFLGTQTENLRDMVAKGRSLRGERQPMARLTNEQVLDIRAKATSGLPAKVLAIQYSIARRTAERIIARARWRHL